MTEHGRGTGSQPWYPDDPLFGDQGWDGNHPAARQADPYADPYAGQYQQGQGEVYPQGQPYGPGGDPYGQQQDPYGTGGHPQYDPYAGGGQQGQTYQDPQQAAYGGGWDQQGQGEVYPQGQPYGPGGDPYGQQQDPYGTGGHPQYDPYAGGGQQGSHGQAGPGAPQRQDHPGGDTGWDDGQGPDWDPRPDRGEHAFFADRDDDADRGRGRDGADGGRDGDDGYDDEDDGRRGRRGGGTKRRGGCACMVVALGLTSVVGGIGYFGYQFYESRFGDAPDYSGDGSGSVQVDVPEGSSLSDMGNILKKAGVVKSHDAFVSAAEENGKSAGIHAGVYTLKKEMSASSAIDMMLDPASQSALIIPEGLRATQIYELIDKKLEKKPGTTKKAAADGDLGLPEWADGNPEGLLFPAKYTVGPKSSPESVLKGMVKRAEAEFQKVGLEAEAKKLDRTPEEIVAIASLIQAEAQEDADFGKVSRVIYNRLDDGMALQFDSTINYAKGESKLNTTVEDTKFDSPYNTYLHDGLPPGPIDNPGNQALDAALDPTAGDWLFFVSVKPGETRFTASHTEHEKNVQDFNDYQREHGNGG
ncbi:endolytic transglycosylase MltG [Streptomyces phytohabitans]|uniref:endolytic transglycosylase MltG n=1 Tax=Streptomyces phytohabitans TaxID=1150371 RepID=UPI00345C4861